MKTDNQRQPDSIRAGARSGDTVSSCGNDRLTAVLLAMEGARVVIRNVDAGGASRLREEMRRHGVRGESYPLEARSETGWQSLIEQISARWGQPDIVRRAPADLRNEPIRNMTLAEWRRQWI